MNCEQCSESYSIFSELWIERDFCNWFVFQDSWFCFENKVNWLTQVKIFKVLVTGSCTIDWFQHSGYAHGNSLIGEHMDCCHQKDDLHLFYCIYISWLFILSILSKISFCFFLPSERLNDWKDSKQKELSIFHHTVYQNIDLRGSQKILGLGK